MSSNQALIDSQTIRQIFIQRYSKGEAKRLIKHINRLSKELKEIVGTHYSVSRAKSTANKLQKLTKALLDQYGDELTSDIKDFAIKESQFAGNALVASTTINEFSSPSLNQIVASVTNSKMKLITGSKTQKMTIEQAVKLFSSKKAKDMAQLIRDGGIAGKTTPQIVGDITNLINGKVKHQAESLVKTVTNHVASVARAETYKQNSDVIIGEEFVATLDSRTSITCSSLDGNKYERGKAPQPPLHYSCRSVVTPLINPEYNLGANITGERATPDGPVSGQTTYGGWLKRQNGSVQDEVLGIDRAKLFRSGKLSIGKFTDDTGRVYDLDELEELNPLAFSNGGAG